MSKDNKGSTGAKTLPNGNAALTCRGCGVVVDKGCPPIPGQDDSTFKCETCHAAPAKATTPAK